MHCRCTCRYREAEALEEEGGASEAGKDARTQVRSARREREEGGPPQATLLTHPANGRIDEAPINDGADVTGSNRRLFDPDELAGVEVRFPNRKEWSSEGPYEYRRAALMIGTDGPW